MHGELNLDCIIMLAPLPEVGYCAVCEFYVPHYTLLIMRGGRCVCSLFGFGNWGIKILE